MKNIIYALVVLLLFSSCENGDWEFEDFEYQSVYFAHQYPVRTITLGEDIFDTSMDNEWRFKILATMGGVYENDKDVAIDVQVANEMLNGLAFSGSGEPIVAMPGNYYSMESQQIVIPEGKITGGVEVQLTEDFFADPLSIETTYVIPLRMASVINADTILSGEPNVEAPNPAVAGDWAVQPKNYVFYAVKYINPWHGFYLKRGVETITGKNGNTELDTVITKHEEYVENDEVKMLSTASLNTIEYPLIFKDEDGSNFNVNLLLSFDASGNCSVSSGSDDYTASGSGSFVKRGEKNSWGGQDRDAIYLSYEVDLTNIHVEATDTLVMRNRGVAMELFEPVLE